MPADGHTTSPTSFGLADATDILAPYLRAEQDAEAARKRIHEREQARFSGVCMSGMGPGPFQGRSDEQIRADAEARLARREAWKASPRGRLHAAIVELAETGFHEAASTLSGIFDRSLAMGPVDAKAIGATLILLAPINTSTSRGAIEACGEMLLSREAA